MDDLLTRMDRQVDEHVKRVGSHDGMVVYLTLEERFEYLTLLLRARPDVRFRGGLIESLLFRGCPVEIAT